MTNTTSNELEAFLDLFLIVSWWMLFKYYLISYSDGR